MQSLCATTDRCAPAHDLSNSRPSPDIARSLGEHAFALSACALAAQVMRLVAALTKTGKRGPVFDRRLVRGRETSRATRSPVKILVTGGAGYIGSVVAEQAVAAGHVVTVVDNLSLGNRAAVPPECEFVEGDFGDADLLDRILAGRQIEVIVHLAAEAAIAPSMTDPALYFGANLTKGLVLLDAMRRRGVTRLVFSSTAATYGAPEQLPITEDHPHRPVNAYGESKYLFERCLEWYHRAYGINAVVFRYFNAAGASHACGEDRPHETHLIPLALDVAMGRRDALDVFGQDYPTRDGSCLRDYVHVVDIGEAHIRAIAQVDRIGLGSFNIGSGTGHTVLDVIEAVRRVTGKPVPVRLQPRRCGDPAALVASAARAAEVLGWRPRYPSLDDIVASAWQWRLTHPHGYAKGRD